MKQRSSTCGEFHAGNGLNITTFGKVKEGDVFEFDGGTEESDVDWLPLGPGS